MRWEVRARSNWTDPVTAKRRGAHLFKVSWAQALVELNDECWRISPDEEPLVVIEIDVIDGDVRRDGMLRRGAKVGQPGVVVSFKSIFGPLRLATDAYEQVYSGGLEGWQANARAVGLTLRALRDLDRWGVSRRGEQYTGWKALPPGSGKIIASEFADASAAERWMRNYAESTLGLAHAATVDLPLLYRRMSRMMHPDTGAARSEWDRLSEAHRLLKAEGRLS